MSLTILNPRILDFINHPSLKSKDFDRFSSLLMDKKMLDLHKDYLQLYYNLVLDSELDTREIQSITINYGFIRKFLSSFIFIYFPGIHQLEEAHKIGKELLNISRQIHFLVKAISLYLKNINPDENLKDNDKYKTCFLPLGLSLFKKLVMYLETFDRWKKYDLENLIFKMSYDYYKFEKKMLESKSNELMLELKKECLRQKRRITKMVDKLDKDNGLIKFYDYLGVINEFNADNDELANEIFIQRVSNLMHTNTMIEDWDKLEFDMEDGDYKLLEKMLDELKEVIKDCKPRDDKFHLEIDEVLDANFIISQLKDNVYQIYDFQKLITYFINTLQKFQSPSEDENTTLFKEELEVLIRDCPDNIPFIVRFLLENVYFKFDNIRRQVYIINKLIKKDDSSNK